MKDYITKKEYKGKDMLGRDITIPVNMPLDKKNQYLRYNNIPICTEDSYIAKNYLVYNGDGNAARRKDFINYLLRRSRKWKSGIDVYDEFGNFVKTEDTINSDTFTPLEMNFLLERYKKYIKSLSPFMFTDEFYRAPIEDLKKIVDFMKRPVGEIKRED